MRSLFRSSASLMTILGLLLLISPLSAMAQAARLEGVVVGIDGLPAEDFRVHLIGDAGRDLAQSATDDRGVYSFQDLPAGDYALGIENTEGGMAPVLGPPVRLAENELARRDLKLLQADPSQPQSMANYSAKDWWQNLTPAAKAWSIVAIVVVVGVSIALLNDDDASEFMMPEDPPPAR